MSVPFKVVLCNPTTERQSDFYPDGSPWLREHLGLGYLASYLEAHSTATVAIIDSFVENLTVTQVAQRIVEFAPDVLGLSIRFHHAEAALGELFAQLRQRGFAGHVVVGGNHATFTAAALLGSRPEIDSVVLGEGEGPLLALAEALREGRSWDQIDGLAFREGDRVVQRPARPIEGLDELPFPRRDTLALVLGRGGMPAVSTSRGCWGRCSFCAVRPFYGKRWRARSADSIVSEMAYLHRQHGASRLFLLDDCFVGPGKKGREQLNAFITALRARELPVTFTLQLRAQDVEVRTLRAMHEIGLRVVYIGLESAYQPTLDFFHKDVSVEVNLRAVRALHEARVAGVYSFIFFHPRSTLEEFDANLAFMREMKDINLFWTAARLVCTPGTDFAASLSEVPVSTWVDGFSYFDILDPQTARFADTVGRCIVPSAQAWWLLDDCKVRVHMASHSRAEDLDRFMRMNTEVSVEAVEHLTRVLQDFRRGDSPDQIVNRYLSPFQDLGERVKAAIAMLSPTHLDTTTFRFQRLSHWDVALEGDAPSAATEPPAPRR